MKSAKYVSHFKPCTVQSLYMHITSHRGRLIYGETEKKSFVGNPVTPSLMLSKMKKDEKKEA